MSYPFGASPSFDDKTIAEQLRAFDAAVADFARARVNADTVGKRIAAGPLPAEEDERQRLADAGQELFIAGETLKAQAMILAAHGVFTEAAKYFSHELAGPY